MLKDSLLILPLTLVLSGCQACGYSSQGNDLSGQVKKVVSHTPIVCPDYDEVDISMGYLNNGVGSISKEDVLLTIRNPQDVQPLRKAAQDGSIVKATYNVFRASPCEPDHELISFQIVK